MSEITERLRNRIHDSHMDAERLMDDALVVIEAQEARIAELEKALGPFAFNGLAVELERFDDETAIEVHFPRASQRKATPVGRVYVEDVLKVRAALSKPQTQ